MRFYVRIVREGRGKPKSIHVRRRGREGKVPKTRVELRKYFIAYPSW